jgi:hypothetical protein
LEIEKTTVWIIMSKDRKVVAKGTPRNRELVRVDDKKDRKRYLTYTSEAKARAGYTVSGFYGKHLIEGFSHGDSLSDHLEPVKCEMTIRTIE